MEILARGVFVSYWFRNDNRLPQGRLAVASYIIVGMIGVLLIGFWKLQVIDADKYSSLAERNRVRYIPVIAPRGRMLDRDGRVLVDNRPSFSVLRLPDDLAQVEKHLSAVTDGIRREVGKSIGQEKERLATQEAISGKQILLTIDFDLQQVAEQALGARPGAAVALDPRTGEVLAMVSHPALDANDFAVRISGDDWKNLNEDRQKPLLNRAIQAQLAPG